MLQIIFGDDEHTAADGPYARLMKTRKWLYLGSIALLGIELGLYQEPAALGLLKIIRLPTETLTKALVFGVGYLLIQYAFLVFQLLATYDIVLSERFTFRRADELATARLKVDEARAAYRERRQAFARDSQVALNRRLVGLETEISGLQSEFAASSKKADEVAVDSARDSDQRRNANWQKYRSLAALAVAEDRLAEIRRNPEKAFSRLDPDDDEEVRPALAALKEAEEGFYALQRMVPSMRFGYRALEILIDVFRLLPPILLSAAVVWRACT